MKKFLLLILFFFSVYGYQLANSQQVNCNNHKIKLTHKNFDYYDVCQIVEDSGVKLYTIAGFKNPYYLWSNFYDFNNDYKVEEQSLLALFSNESINSSSQDHNLGNFEEREENINIFNFSNTFIYYARFKTTKGFAFRFGAYKNSGFVLGDIFELSNSQNFNDNYIKEILSNLSIEGFFNL